MTKTKTPETFDVALMRDYAEKLLKRDELKAKLAEANKDLAHLEEVVLNDLVASGLPNVPVMIGKRRVTLYRHSTVRVDTRAIEDREAVAAALKRARVGWLVVNDWNANRVSSWVRERLASGKDLPPSLAEVLPLKTDVSVGYNTSEPKDSTSKRAADTLARRK